MKYGKIKRLELRAENEELRKMKGLKNGKIEILKRWVKMPEDYAEDFWRWKYRETCRDTLLVCPVKTNKNRRDGIFSILVGTQYFVSYENGCIGAHR